MLHVVCGLKEPDEQQVFSVSKSATGWADNVVLFPPVPLEAEGIWYSTRRG